MTSMKMRKFFMSFLRIQHSSRNSFQVIPERFSLGQRLVLEMREFRDLAKLRFECGKQGQAVGAHGGIQVHHQDLVKKTIQGGAEPDPFLESLAELTPADEGPGILRDFQESRVEPL